MNINFENDQNLGSICDDIFLLGYHGTGGIIGSGNLTGVGQFKGSGGFCADGEVSGSGVFWVSGVFNGNIEGYKQNAQFPTGNNRPFITFSGYSDEDIDIPNLIYYNTGTNTFSGADAFSLNGGMLTGQLVSGWFKGSGKACGTGKFSINGSAKASGLAEGTGSYYAKGYFKRTTFTEILNPCLVCDNTMIASGDYRFDGIFTGTGIYKQTTHLFEETAPYVYGGYSVDSYSKGTGQYIGSGHFSGFSQKLYYGFGIFTGEAIQYSIPAHPETPQEVFGTGHFSGDGIINSKSGYYSGYGIFKGSGSFMGSGIAETLLGNVNIISGAGCCSGYGSVFALGTGNTITGTYCFTNDFDSEGKFCGPFPSYLTNCSDIGSIGIQIFYQGSCVKYKRRFVE